MPQRFGAAEPHVRVPGLAVRDQPRRQRRDTLLIYFDMAERAGCWAGGGDDAVRFLREKERVMVIGIAC